MKQEAELSDADALAAVPRALRTGRCYTCDLPPDLRALIEDDRASAAPHAYRALSQFLQDRRGIRLHATALRDHFLAGHVGQNQ